MATPSSEQVLKRKPLRDRSGRDEPVKSNEATLGQSETDYGKSAIENVPPHNSLELLGVLYHFSMTVFYALLLYYGTKLVNNNMHILDPEGKMPKYGGRFKFLTHINQWFQLVFFGAQFFTDLLKASQFKNKMQNFCDIFLTTVAVPTSLFVATTFWGIYAYDRRLVGSVRYDLFVPPYMNHFWHTTVAVWVLFEIVFCFHRYPSAGIAVSINFAVNTGYLCWVFWVFQKTGFWVYPILKVLPLHFMALFCGSCMFYSLLLYFIGKAFAKLRWGKTLYIE